MGQCFHWLRYNALTTLNKTYIRLRLTLMPVCYVARFCQECVKYTCWTWGGDTVNDRLWNILADSSDFKLLHNVIFTVITSPPLQAQYGEAYKTSQNYDRWAPRRLKASLTVGGLKEEQIVGGSRLEAFERPHQQTIQHVAEAHRSPTLTLITAARHSVNKQPLNTR